MVKKKYNVLDLFCGAGGLSRGFIDAGFNVRLGVDFDDMALKTFEMNHEGATAMKLDLFDLDNADKIQSFFEQNGYSLDVLVGGPPCQGFSLAGPRQIDDSRNVLYRAMVKTARVLKPKAVVLENVPGMIQLHGGLVKEKIIKDFSEMGYKMGEPQILYAPDYGVPQIRKRVVFVGLLDSDTEFSYPKPTLTPEKYITCEQAIGDLPALIDIVGDKIQDYSSEPLSEYQKQMRKNSDKIYNHEGTIHDPKTKKFIAMVPEGKNYKSLPPEYEGIYKYHEALTRYHSKKPSPTINTGHRSHFHYKWNRIPTVRESARLQSFKDDFIFYGNKTQQYRQVGNAVPPLLGKAIATEIKKWLDSYETKNKTIKMLDLFAGCGGLTDGFMQTGLFCDVAAVEWKEPQVRTLRNRLKNKWGEKDANERVLHFDIQREKELFEGWSDDVDYGNSKGLDFYVNKAKGINIIIGGPPCQAYSVAGRVRDEHGMADDYRNFLFEHYLSIVDRYQPDLFIFENVPGILSAAPHGKKVAEIIPLEFSKKGYEITKTLKDAIVNAADYDVPQNRKRIILVGIRRKSFEGIDVQKMLEDFYKNILPSHKDASVITVKQAIGDLPTLVPYWDEEHHSKRKSHSTPRCELTWHVPRYNNLRDMDTFRLLAEDLESGKKEYDSKKIAELYEKKIGSKSPIHRYHVLNPDEPSTTIIAHLHKDGNRFIHYDSKQARTITPREAGLLQSFDKDFEFLGSRGNVYEMIGNAVPPKLAKALAESVVALLRKYKPEKYG